MNGDEASGIREQGQRVQVRHGDLERDSEQFVLTVDVRWADAWRSEPGQPPANWNAAWLFVKVRYLIEQQHADSNALLTHLGLDEAGQASARTQLAAAQQQGLASLRLSRALQLDSRSGPSPGHQEALSKEVTVSLVQGAEKYVSKEWGPWQHVRLSGCTAPSTAGAQLSETEDQMGLYVYRAEPGQGPMQMQGIRLRWCDEQAEHHAFPAQVWVHAIEMVYVPEGAFVLGEPADPAQSGGPTNAFHQAVRPGDSGPWGYTVQSEAAITVVEPSAGEPGLTWNDQSYGTWADIPAAFPKGHQAFYCMRGKVTQGQYAEFINSLAGSAKTERFPYGGQGDYRYTIYKTIAGQRYATRPQRACNWVAWADAIAYLWWAGLRPLTEMEWEKACRGPVKAVAGEYAWGNTKLVLAGIILGAEMGSETVTGNCYIAGPETPLIGGDAGYGPVRDDAFSVNGGASWPAEYDRAGEALADDSREATGASYYGVMAMSGNLWDFTVTAGLDRGRAFTGVNGDGQLTSTGQPDWDTADPPWPGGNNIGAGFRGGSWYTSSGQGRVADRTSATGIPGYIFRSHDTGIRGCRTAPGEASDPHEPADANP